MLLDSWDSLFEDLSSFPNNQDVWQWPNLLPKEQEKLRAPVILRLKHLLYN